ncbi:DHA2 family efflux MFS transporter permease subunit, partial [Singulisphaera rosea]
LGRRNYFLMSIAVFTLASGLCGMATSLEQLILFRILQGIAGGGLQPSSQGVLIDAFPPEKQSAAMTLFSVAALIAPVVGPTLGGYLTVFYNWRWIFYINIPVGILGLIACYVLLDDPEYLKKERVELLRKPLNFDYIGMSLLTLGVACWEILLSKGQEWDWYNDPTWRSQTLAILLVLSVILLFLREMNIPNPVVNFRPLADRNFAACCIIICSAYGILYAASTSLPGLLQSLFGYDAYVSGLVLSPAGIGSVMMLLVAGTLLSKGTDARKLIFVGLIIMAIGNYWMALLNLGVSPTQVIWPRVVTFTGISMLFAPLNVAAFLYIPREMRGAAVGLFALIRNEGGSIGTSLAKTVQQRREQFHTARVGEFLDPLNPTLNTFSEQTQASFVQYTGDVAASKQMSLQVLADLRQQQAASLAYFDDFWIFAVLSLALIPLVFLMKRSVAEKGAHIGAE